MKTRCVLMFVYGNGDSGSVSRSLLLLLQKQEKACWVCVSGDRFSDERWFSGVAAGVRSTSVDTLSFLGGGE